MTAETVNQTSDDCRVQRTSSAVCARGTRSCVADHLDRGEVDFRGDVSARAHERICPRHGHSHMDYSDADGVCGHIDERGPCGDPGVDPSFAQGVFEGEQWVGFLAAVREEAFLDGGTPESLLRALEDLHSYALAHHGDDYRVAMAAARAAWVTCPACEGKWLMSGDGGGYDGAGNYHDPGCPACNGQGAVTSEKAAEILAERREAQPDTVTVSRELLELLAPEEPINQDEMGGCVWCGGGPARQPWGYATSDPRHHSPDCPYIAARRALAEQPSTQGESS